MAMRCRQTDTQTDRDDRGDLIICPMLCCSNGTDNNDSETLATVVLFCVDGDIVDVQYSNWENGEPQTTAQNNRVVVTANNHWHSDKSNENVKHTIVCQSQ